MKYPFKDTPANRQLSDMIDQCIGEDSTGMHVTPRYVVHSLPQNIIKYDKSQENFSVFADKVLLFIFDKETGKISASSFQNTYGEDFRENMKHFLNVEGFYRDLENQDDSLLPEKYEKIFNSDGSLVKGVSMLSLGSVDYDIGSYTTYRNPIVVTYPQSTKYEDFQASIDDSSHRDDKPSIRLVMEDEEANYDQKQKDFDQFIHRSISKRSIGFTNKVKEHYFSALVNTWKRDHPDIDPAEIERTAETFRQHYPNMETDKTGFYHLNGKPYIAVRNRLQLLEALDSNRLAFMRVLSSPGVMEGIDSGKPLKEALSQLPLLNHSKKSIQKFLHNAVVLVDQLRLRQKDDGKVVFLEKGPAPFSEKDEWCDLFADEYAANYAAFMSTLPESYFNTEGRDSVVSNMLRVFDLPYMEETLKCMVSKVRSGEMDIKKSLSWLPGFLEKKGDEITTYEGLINDAEGIVNELYIGSITAHVKFSSHEGPITNDDVDRFVRSDLPSPYLMTNLTSTGNYKNIITTEEKVHRYNQTLHKLGKPNGNIEWDSTLEQPYQHGDYTITALTSNSELTEEGSAMNHCVGSYLRHVLEHESYIFSVTKNGRRVCTAELSGDHPDNIDIVQIRGMSNSLPGHEAEVAVQSLLSDIQSEKIPFDFRPCADVERGLDDLTPMEKGEVELGLRFSDREFILTAIDQLRDIAPNLDIFDTLRNNPRLDVEFIASLEEDYHQAFLATYEASA